MIGPVPGPISTSPLLAAAPAAGPAAERLFGDLLPTLGMLVLIILVGGGIAVWLKRRYQGGDASGGVGFTLGDLRELRARGEISEEEFEKARAGMVRGVAGTGARDGASRVAGSIPPARSAQGDADEGNGSPPRHGKG